MIMKLEKLVKELINYVWKEDEDLETGEPVYVIHQSTIDIFNKYDLDIYPINYVTMELHNKDVEISGLKDKIEELEIYNYEIDSEYSFEVDNIADQAKAEYLLEIFDKYSLEELERRLS